MNDTSPIDPSRPHWRSGLRAGVLAFASVLLVECLCLWSWLDGALMAGVEGSVSRTLPMFPGSAVSVEWTEQGGGYGMHPGWVSLAIGLVAFLGVARPWRLLARARA